jgi:hypothetical protein
MTVDNVAGACRRALAFLSLLACAHTAAAQSAVGTGPLTSTLADSEPLTGALSLGPVKVAPGIVVREIGWDSNVFDETEEEGPKEDFVASLTPDVAMFSRLRFVKLSAYAGAEMTYFQKYESERSFGHLLRGRVDVLLSRVRPFVGAGQTKTRTRPNGAIDVRADRKETELSGGVAYDLGTHSVVYAAAVQMATRYENVLNDGVDIGATLSRDSVDYSGGLKTDLTPLTSLTLAGSVREDTFLFDPLRNAENRMASATLKFGAEAVVTGAVIVAWNDFKAVDPLVEPYRGLTGSVALAYSLLDVGRLGLIAMRRQEYSFDAAEGYYLENSVNLTYNHRLFGAVDAQVHGGHGIFQYGFRVGFPAHTDTLDTVDGGVGYNLRNRTRISLNYEFARRRSPALAERNYDRKRAFLAWSYAF